VDRQEVLHQVVQAIIVALRQDLALALQDLVIAVLHRVVLPEAVAPIVQEALQDVHPVVEAVAEAVADADNSQ